MHIREAGNQKFSRAIFNSGARRYLNGIGWRDPGDEAPREINTVMSGCDGRPVASITVMPVRASGWSCPANNPTDKATAIGIYPRMNPMWVGREIVHEVRREREKLLQYLGLVAISLLKNARWNDVQPAPVSRESASNLFMPGSQD